MTVTLDAPLEDPPDNRKKYMSTFIKRRYGATIPAIGPGQELSNAYWSGQAVAGLEGLVNEDMTTDDAHGRP